MIALDPACPTFIPAEAAGMRGTLVYAEGIPAVARRALEVLVKPGPDVIEVAFATAGAGRAGSAGGTASAGESTLVGETAAARDSALVGESAPGGECTLAGGAAPAGETAAARESTPVNASSPAADTAEAVMRRARKRGEWERAQTHRSLLPYLVEEVAEFSAEVAAWEEHGDESALLKELGDVYLQVLFHAEIAAERGAFTMADVAESFVAKMRSRAPYLFDGSTGPMTAQEQDRIWQEAKAREARTASAREQRPEST